MKFSRCLAMLALLALTLAPAACKKADPAAASGKPKEIVIGYVGKSQSNQVFVVALQGARDAAAELEKKHGIKIRIEMMSPAEENPTQQAQAIENLARSGANGIVLACTEPGVLVNPINAAVADGTLVAIFDSDAANSKRFAYYGADHVECGRKTMDALAKSMGGKGTVAILAGNQSAPNLQLRVKGAKEALAKYPEMKLVEGGSGGVFYNTENAEEAAKVVQNAQRANPTIQGWCFIGGWPLFAQNALPWEPGTIKVASMDALPQQLAYIRSKHVDTLYAQDCYGWGYKSVQTLVAKIMENKDPNPAIAVDPLYQVTPQNVEEWAKKWEVWLKK